MCHLPNSSKFSPSNVFPRKVSYVSDDLFIELMVSYRCIQANLCRQLLKKESLKMQEYNIVYS